MSVTVGQTYGEFTIVPGYFGPRVAGKLGGMRKARLFSVQPRSDGTIQVQADNSIGVFDFRTGEGRLNTKGHYFTHLNYSCGAVDFTFPTEFVAACLAVCPALDSETSRGEMTIVNTVKVV